MKSINIIALTGQLASEPEIRSFQSGSELATFRFCFWTSSKVDGEWKDKGNFVEVKHFKPNRNFYNLLHKGSFVGLQGRLEMDEWIDKNTNAKRSKIVVVANEVTFTVPKSKMPEGQSQDSLAPIDGYKSESTPGTVPMDQAEDTPF
jgi:single-strand DNA-binding protein